MIYWFDSFMAIFGFKRPEVWEAERKEHDVTFPAPHASKEPRKRSNVRSKKAGKRSQSAEGSANVRSGKILTYRDIISNEKLQMHIRNLVEQEYSDATIARKTGCSEYAITKFRRSQGWRVGHDD